MLHYRNFTVFIFWVAGTILPGISPGQTSEENSNDIEDFIVRQIVPVQNFVRITPIIGSKSPDQAVALQKEQLEHLTVYFDRNQINPDNGPQFLKITTTVTKRDGSLYDKYSQYAFTFAKESTSAMDTEKMKQYANEILRFGFVSKRKIDSVDVRMDSIPEWSLVKIEITPDDDYTKYSRRLGTHQSWFYRLKGNRFESAFFFGIPKVIYDSNKKDTMEYGNASAMLRFYYLDGETGERYPVNIGIGTFGISTPIDVRTSGGGFALSLFFDIVQMSRQAFGVDLSRRVNAGVEITPFFPIQKQARLLFNARVGFSP